MIAGGGPAGASCALALARAGRSVTIVERAQFPRQKVCGEYLNASVLRALDDLGMGAAARGLGYALDGVRIVVAPLDPLELRFPEPALALERATLDSALLDAAVTAGARLVRGRAEDVVMEDGRVSGLAVRDERGDLTAIRARFAIGADGIGSLVARRLGLVQTARGKQRFALGGHYRGFGDLGGCVEMHVGQGAYFALNPLSGDRTNVMVVVARDRLAQWSATVNDGMRTEAARLAGGRRSFDGVEREGPRVSIGPLDFRVKRAWAPGALLAGDAAGFVNPFTGQGVELALRSGADAAATILAATGDASKEDALLAAYGGRRARELAVRRRSATFVNLLTDVPVLARRAAERLRRVPELNDALLAALGAGKTLEAPFVPWRLARLVL
ncbi:MAG: FAD-dependent monooxygenase [Candidatus Eremiobacteraeota bacterium]|nr:FAD-dependent monooxygenase [Candidatus Eremiobacteraeota bacterium]